MAVLNKCIFSKKSGRLSSGGPEILALRSHIQKIQKQIV